MYQTPRMSFKRPYTTSDDIEEKFTRMDAQKTEEHDARSITDHENSKCMFVQILLFNDRGCKILEPVKKTIILCNSWFLKFSVKYTIPEHVIFTAIYILYQYVVKDQVQHFVHNPYVVASACLNIANKLGNINNQFKPSFLVQTEPQLKINSKEDIIDAERTIIHVLDWAFFRMQTPHIFLDSCYGIFDIHPMIKKTVPSCLRKCILSSELLFLSGSKLSVYCLLASFLHHNYHIFTDEVMRLYQMNENKDETREIVQRVLVLFKNQQICHKTQE